MLAVNIELGALHNNTGSNGSNCKCPPLLETLAGLGVCAQMSFSVNNQGLSGAGHVYELVNARAFRVMLFVPLRLDKT